MWGFMKVCESLWMWMCEVEGLRCELFKCGLWSILAPPKFWCSWHCCCWWLLNSLKHSSNWNVYNFSGDSNNLVYKQHLYINHWKGKFSSSSPRFHVSWIFLLYIFYFALHVSTNLFQLKFELPCLAFNFFGFFSLCCFLGLGCNFRSTTLNNG